MEFQNMSPRKTKEMHLSGLDKLHSYPRINEMRNVKHSARPWHVETPQMAAITKVRKK